MTLAIPIPVPIPIALALQRLQLLRPDEVGFFSWALQDSSKEAIGLVLGRKSAEILFAVE